MGPGDSVQVTNPPSRYADSIYNNLFNNRSIDIWIQTPGLGEKNVAKNALTNAKKMKNKLCYGVTKSISSRHCGHYCSAHVAFSTACSLYSHPLPCRYQERHMDPRTKLISGPLNFSHITHMGPGEGVQLQQMMKQPPPVSVSMVTVISHI